MTKPSALVIGPMKSGTSWIYRYLLQRGDVCLPSGIKETFFFDKYFERGEQWYFNHFESYISTKHSTILEVAPSIFHCSEAPSRVASTLGPVPLLVTVRDPVKRAWSHYMHLRRKGHTRESLETAIERFPEIIDASRFDMQLARWRRAAPDAAITVLRLEDLIADRDGYARMLCEALDIPFRSPPDDLGEMNAGGVPPSFVLAKLGRNAADLIRGSGGYAIVNAAKRIGLKNVFFGKNGARRIEPDDSEIALLKARLNLEDASPASAIALASPQIAGAPRKV